MRVFFRYILALLPLLFAACDAYDDFTDGVYNPEANTISYDCVYAGMDFNVVLTLN